MIDAMGDDHKLALFDSYVTISQLQKQASFYDQKQFILGIVVMPDKLAFKLHQFYVRIVQFANDLGTPEVMKGIQFLAQADGANCRSVLHMKQSLGSVPLRVKELNRYREPLR